MRTHLMSWVQFQKWKFPLRLLERIFTVFFSSLTFVLFFVDFSVSFYFLLQTNKHNKTNRESSLFQQPHFHCLNPSAFIPPFFGLVYLCFVWFCFVFVNEFVCKRKYTKKRVKTHS